MPIVFQPQEPLAPVVSEGYGALDQYMRDREFAQRQQAQAFDQQRQIAQFGQQAYQFEAQRQPSARDVWQGRQQDQHQQRQFELQGQLQQVELSQAEQMRMQRIKNDLATIDSMGPQEQGGNGTLSQDEWQNLRLERQTGLHPLQQRLQQAQITRSELEAEHMQTQNEMQSNLWRAQAANNALDPESRMQSVTLPDGTQAHFMYDQAGRFQWIRSPEQVHAQQMERANLRVEQMRLEGERRQQNFEQQQQLRENAQQQRDNQMAQQQQQVESRALERIRARIARDLPPYLPDQAFDRATGNIVNSSGTVMRDAHGNPIQAQFLTGSLQSDNELVRRSAGSGLNPREFLIQERANREFEDYYGHAPRPTQSVVDAQQWRTVGTQLVQWARQNAPGGAQGAAIMAAAQGVQRLLQLRGSPENMQGDERAQYDRAFDFLHELRTQQQGATDFSGGGDWGG